MRPRHCRFTLFKLLLAGALSAQLHPSFAAAAENKLLITNAKIVTLEDDQLEPFTGYLLVGHDGALASVGVGTPPAVTSAAATYDAAGKIVMPGFLSGHSHLWQSAYRGIAADQWVREWVSLIHLKYGPHFVAGDPYAFTLHGALDYLRHGITTTYNYTQNMNFTPEVYEEQYQAELDAGGRFIFGYALKSGKPFEEVRRNFEAFLAKVKAAPPNPLLLKINIASDGARWGPEYTQFEFEVMREHGMDMQMHYLEPPNHQVTDRESFPWIEAADGLSPKLIFAHFIHTDDNIVKKAGAARAGMIWNPLSNGRLASGLADIPKYQKAGISIGMGIDGQASADISDPFENMRMGLYGLRMKYKDPLIMQPIDVLKLHTIGTAKTLGVDDRVGSLKVGKFADFLVVDPGNMDTGPVFDVYASLVFACSIANIERIYVGGDFVVERGQPRLKDFTSVAEEVKRRVTAVRTRQAAALPMKPAK